MKIAVVGGYGVALTMRVDRAPEAGETVSGGVLTTGPGGKGSNQAVAAARLGAHVSLLTAVGEDAGGEAGRALWNSENVVASPVVVAETATMTGFITVDRSGENRISIAPGALERLAVAAVADFGPAIREAEVLLVSLEIPLAAAAAALAIARESGTVAVLNPAPAAALGPEHWDNIDVLTPNLTEARLLLGRREGDGSSPASLARELASRFAGVVVLTMGADGVLVDDGSEAYRVDAAPVERVVDTAGAGDAFTAALGVGLAIGLELRESVGLAVRAGAHAVQIAEVVPALPTRRDLGLSTDRGQEGAA